MEREATQADVGGELSDITSLSARGVERKGTHVLAYVMMRWSITRPAPMARPMGTIS